MRREKKKCEERNFTKSYWVNFLFISFEPAFTRNVNENSVKFITGVNLFQTAYLIILIISNQFCFNKRIES